MLFPDGAYAKRGDAIVRKKIDEDVDGRRFVSSGSKGP